MWAKLSLLDLHLEILLWRGVWSDLELFNQHWQHRRRDKRGQDGSQMDIVNVQMQQRQQHGHRLLLKPRHGIRDRQVVQSAPKHLGEGSRDLNRGKGVVTLAHVKHPRQPSVCDGAEILAVEAVLGTPERKNDRTVGQVCGKVPVVRAFNFVSVAAANQIETLEFAGLNRVDDGRSSIENGAMAKTNKRRAFVFRGRKSS